MWIYFRILFLKTKDTSASSWPFWLCRIIIGLWNISDKIYRRNKTHFCAEQLFLRKPCLMWDNVNRCDTASQGTDDSTLRRMRSPCWMNKPADSGRDMVILNPFPQKHRSHECALCHVTCALVVLFASFLPSLSHSEYCWQRTAWKQH